MERIQDFLNLNHVVHTQFGTQLCDSEKNASQMYLTHISFTFPLFCNRKTESRTVVSTALQRRITLQLCDKLSAFMQI
jgi:hypothetical protein